MGAGVVPRANRCGGAHREDKHVGVATEHGICDSQNCADHLVLNSGRPRTLVKALVLLACTPAPTPSSRYGPISQSSRSCPVRALLRTLSANFTGGRPITPKRRGRSNLWRGNCQKLRIPHNGGHRGMYRNLDPPKSGDLGRALWNTAHDHLWRVHVQGGQESWGEVV